MNIIGMIQELELMYKKKKKNQDYVGLETDENMFLINGKEIIIKLGDKVHKFEGVEGDFFQTTINMIKEGKAGSLKR